MSENRKALVTGAAGGIGRAITEALISGGHRVVLADRERASLEAYARELGPNAFPLVLDVGDAAGTAGLIDAIPAEFKPLDILVNNAGHHIGGSVKFVDGSADDWAAIVETNLIGLMRVTRAVLPSMVEQNRGDIVNISSINALRIIPDAAPYSASKAGVHSLSDTLRAELTSTDLRVIEVHPGLTKTNISLSKFRGDAAKVKDYYDRFRMSMVPADIARSVMFAISEPPHVQIAQIVVLPTDRS